MPLFEIRNRKAKKINLKAFKNELELHALIDENLEEIFNVRFIKSEHITSKHGRIETLAIDEANRPLVIEYKLSKEKGQLSQANRYMTWILQNPDSFELLVRKNIKNFKDEVDFTNPRMLCFAQEYSIDDKCLALSLGAELWKYRYYENNTLVITREEEPEQLIPTKKTVFTIKKIKRKPRSPKTLNEHLQGASKELIDLFTRLDVEILNISSEIDRHISSYDIYYKTSLNFAYLKILTRKNCLKIHLRTLNDEMIDEKGLTSNVSESWSYGNITRVLYFYPKDEKSGKHTIEDVINLINQSYNATQ